MKRILSCFLICISLFRICIFAQSPISVTINDSAVTFDQPPIIMEDRTMVPIRAVCEAMGADVYWSDSARSVGIVKNDIKLLLAIDDSLMMVANVENFDALKALVASGNSDALSQSTTFVSLDAPPRIVGDRTLLPIRAVCEALGATVSWDADSRTVLITYPDALAQDANRDKTFWEKSMAYAAFLTPSAISKTISQMRFTKNYTLTITGLTESDNISALADFIVNTLEQEPAQVESIETNASSITVFFRSEEGFQPETFQKKICEKPAVEFRAPDGTVIISNQHIANVTTKTYNLTHSYSVAVTLTEEGQLLFSSATERIAENPPGENYIGVHVNDMLISAPALETPIYSDTLMITGAFTEENAKQLAFFLNGTYVPAHAKVSIS